MKIEPKDVGRLIWDIQNEYWVPIVGYDTTEEVPVKVGKYITFYILPDGRHFKGQKHSYFSWEETYITFNKKDELNTPQEEKSSKKEFSLFGWKLIKD